LNVDRFLRAYFATSDRRSRPGCVSVEARGPGATLEQAANAEARHVFALTVMGHLERSQCLAPVHIWVLRRYYLWLNPQHVALLRMGDTGRHTMSIGAGESPPPGVGLEESDLQSWCDWAALARDVGLKNGRDAQRVWSEGRGVVLAELERRDSSSHVAHT